MASAMPRTPCIGSSAGLRAVLWGGGYKEHGRADLDLILDSAPTPRGAVIHPDEKVIWTFMVEPVGLNDPGAKVSAHRQRKCVIAPTDRFTAGSGGRGRPGMQAGSRSGR